MRQFFNRQNLLRDARTAAVAVAVSSLVMATPTIAATVTNADKVDGKDAVGAGATVENRAGKLVATNKTTGRLPNNIIAKAPDADTLDGLDSTDLNDADTLDGLDSTDLNDADTLDGLDSTDLRDAQTLDGLDSSDLHDAETLDGRDSAAYTTHWMNVYSNGDIRSRSASLAGATVTKLAAPGRYCVFLPDGINREAAVGSIQETLGGTQRYDIAVTTTFGNACNEVGYWDIAVLTHINGSPADGSFNLLIPGSPQG